MEKKTLLVIDGQGGRIGSQLIAAVRTSCGDTLEIIAVGTNQTATANMLKSNPDAAATGENPVAVNCRRADIVAGPVGIVIADALYGEVTPRMAMAVGQSRAKRVLIPMSRCDNIIVGASGSMSELIDEAAEVIAGLVK